MCVFVCVCLCVSVCVCVCVCVSLPAEKWVRGRAIDKGEVDLGTPQSQAIPPGLFWRFHMTVHHPTYVKFNLSLSHSALLGVYGRRNIPPTHTQVRSLLPDTTHTYTNTHTGACLHVKHRH